VESRCRKDAHFRRRWWPSPRHEIESTGASLGDERRTAQEIEDGPAPCSASNSCEFFRIGFWSSAMRCTLGIDLEIQHV
jgi:hypothetical protein